MIAQTGRKGRGGSGSISRSVVGPGPHTAVPIGPDVSSGQHTDPEFLAAIGGALPTSAPDPAGGTQEGYNLRSILAAAHASHHGHVGAHGSWTVCGLPIWTIATILAVSITLAVGMVLVVRTNDLGSLPHGRVLHVGENVEPDAATDPGTRPPVRHESSHARPPGGDGDRGDGGSPSTLGEHHDSGRPVVGRRVGFRVSDSGLRREAHPAVVHGIRNVDDLFSYSASCKTPSGSVISVTVYASSEEAPSDSGEGGRSKAFMTMQFNDAAAEAAAEESEQGLFVLFYEGADVPPKSHCAFTCMAAS